MVRAEHYLGTTAGSPFYGPPCAPAALGGTPERRLQTEPVPAGWLVQSWSGWEGWTPRDWTPRLQGWKIHVSATPRCAEQTLAETTRTCVEAQVAFKFLPTLAELVHSSSKQGDRGGSGKFVTVYPDDDAQLARLLGLLRTRLAGQEGPYILSDLRVADDAPVFVRYGGIMAVELPGDDDRGVPAIVSGPTTTLVPDVRAPRFSVPAGIEVPDVLRPALERSRRSTPSRLSDFTSIKPLHFSNAGGVYRATLPDGTVRVLREARPHAGLDSRDRCAVQRQRDEQRVLEDLADVPGVQRLVGDFTAWEHRYLELEHVEGTTLTSWVVRTIGLQQDDPAAYARRTTHIAAQLVDVVDRVHARGWALGDVHTGNVLVDEDDTVTVLDLEDATRLDEPREIGFRVFEFCGDPSLTAEQADWFAVARSVMMMYAPDWEVEAVAPGFWAAALGRVRTTYGDEAADQLVALERRYPAGARPALSSEVTVDVPDAAPDEEAAVAGLLGGIAWSRRFSARSAYPGDVTQPGRLVHETLGSGRAGVVLAQQRIGADVDETDLAALAAVAAAWDPAESPGLLSGLAGVALVLADAGRADDAVRAARTALEQSWGRRRLDLAGGQAGTVLAALEVARTTGADDLRVLALEVYGRLHASLVPDTSALRSLTRRRGLYWGLTGVALSDVAAHLAGGGDDLLQRAVSRLRLDVDACAALPSGELMVRDVEGGRVLPYLEWGSAGLWTVATVLERLTGGPVLSTEERAGLAAACTSDFYIYPGLDHGRAGILSTLVAAGAGHAAAADRQSRLLRESLFTRGPKAFCIGDGLLRLSSDLGTGAAGVALALHTHRTDDPYAVLPVSAATAATLARLPLPPEVVSTTTRSTEPRPGPPTPGPPGGSRAAHASAPVLVGAR